MYRVARKRADILKMLLVTTAAMLAICLLALVDTTNKAEAKDSLPENGKIAFHRDHSGQLSIYTAEPDGSNVRKLAGGTYPNWSPDGTKIVFAEPHRADISVVSADGPSVGTFHTIEGTFGLDPTWLPDGTKVAFSKSPRISAHDIYIMDLASSSQTNLTRTREVEEAYPDFSPNGSQICFFRGRLGKSVSGIYVMDADGSDSTLLFKYDVNSPAQCDWSPNGTEVAFPAFGPGGGGELEIYVINADGSGRTALTRNSAVEVEPDWSPDGTKITFASDRDGDYDIYTMDADGSDVAQVTNLPGDEHFPDWQPLPGTTVHQPDTGGPSLLLVASALLISGGTLLYAGLRRSM